MIQEILYIPLDTKRALKFHDKLTKKYSSINYSLAKKAFLNIPTNLIGDALIHKPKRDKEFIEEYEHMEEEDTYNHEISGVLFKMLNHKFIHKYQEIFNNDFFASQFLILPDLECQYFLHKAYEIYCLMSDYNKLIFMDKIFFWKKILIGLGAKSIGIEASIKQHELISEAFDIKYQNTKYDTKRSTTNNSQTYVKHVYSKPKNQPDEWYFEQEEDDFNDDYLYIFPYEKNRKAAFKMYSWLYNDDGQLQLIFEDRLRDLDANITSPTNHEISCKFKNIAFSNEAVQLVSDIGMPGVTEKHSVKRDTEINLIVEF
ncbi:MAG: hypothetical protein U9N34_04905 [Candidatus Cloacimonadota bacterium]|nr:hypothetical protein [Candidatus Cloacimonadota bacterium]